MKVDTHIHLYDKKYQDILEEVIEKAQEAGIVRIIVNGVDRETSLESIRLANKYDFIYAAIGLHPSEIDKEKENDLSWIYELAKNKKVIAIGEIGLDYYWDKSYNDLQRDIFIKQIKIANELKLPVIVHSRDAHQDTFDIMNENQTKGILHAYQSSLELAREYIKLGYYLGIGGVLTFKNAKVIKDVVREIDLDFLLTETDGPYLTPEPFRGKINKPEYIKYILEEISSIKQIDKEIVEEKIYNNYIKLFKE